MTGKIFIVTGRTWKKFRRGVCVRGVVSGTKSNSERRTELKVWKDCGDQKKLRGSNTGKYSGVGKVAGGRIHLPTKSIHVFFCTKPAQHCPSITQNNSRFLSCYKGQKIQNVHISVSIDFRDYSLKFSVFAEYITSLTFCYYRLGQKKNFYLFHKILSQNHIVIISKKQK